MRLARPWATMSAAGSTSARPAQGARDLASSPAPPRPHSLGKDVCIAHGVQASSMSLSQVHEPRCPQSAHSRTCAAGARSERDTALARGIACLLENGLERQGLPAVAERYFQIADEVKHRSWSGRASTLGCLGEGRSLASTEAWLAAPSQVVDGNEKAARNVPESMGCIYDGA